MNYKQQIEAAKSKLQSLWKKADEMQEEIENCFADLDKIKAINSVNDCLDDLAKAIEIAQAKCKTTPPINSDGHEWFCCTDKMPQEGDYIVILNDIEGAEDSGEFVAGMCTHVDPEIADVCPIEISDSYVTGLTWRYLTPQEVSNK